MGSAQTWGWWRVGLEAARLSPRVWHLRIRPLTACMWAQRLLMEVGKGSLENRAKWKPNASSWWQQFPEPQHEQGEATWFLLMSMFPLLHWCRVRGAITETWNSHVATTLNAAQEEPHSFNSAAGILQCYGKQCIRCQTGRYRSINKLSHESHDPPHLFLCELFWHSTEKNCFAFPRRRGMKMYFLWEVTAKLTFLLSH